jgi:glucose-6-phosphate isomerase
MASALIRSPAWQTLQQERQRLQNFSLRDAFVIDPKRVDRMRLAAAGLLFDYSKNLLEDHTLSLLLHLAEQQKLLTMRAAMFAGEKINTTENRAVLHTALRNLSNRPAMLDGVDIMPDIQAMLKKMESFSAAIRGGQWRGATGQTITDIVNIGIGGSDFGARLVIDALAQPGVMPRAHFVANADVLELQRVFVNCDPARTLFIVVSKTFTTQETILNAVTARHWLQEKLGRDATTLQRHMVAVSANRSAVNVFGIPDENIFEFWDWVGGRYSLWSSVGLVIALALGFNQFRALLTGAQAMDEHFRTAPLTTNMPVIMALISVWYRNFHDTSAQAVLPYAQSLNLLPIWFQQLAMESNGKSIDRDNQPVDYATAPVIFGSAGTVGQHSYYQLLHQGTHFIPVDFIGVADDRYHQPAHHQAVLANLIAQSEALLLGRSGSEAAPWRAIPGNRPSNTIMLDRLDAERLGALLALYEHRTFVEGVIWNINSFDQWGVELGKQLAGATLDALKGAGNAASHDSSTQVLLDYLRNRIN